MVLNKESTTIVGDGSTQEEVTKRVAQIKNLIEVCYICLPWLIWHNSASQIFFFWHNSGSIFHHFFNLVIDCTYLEM